MEESFRKFPDLARKVFQSPIAVTRKSSLLRFLAWLKAFLADGQYDSDNLDSTLKQAVDPKRRIFDVPLSDSAGCRAAIIISRISDGKPCVLANYRGTGRRQDHSSVRIFQAQRTHKNLSKEKTEGREAYHFLIPCNNDQNPQLWKV